MSSEKDKGPTAEKPTVAALESKDDASLNLALLSEDAAKATSQEHAMSLWQGLKIYPKAVGWSVLISTAIVMEGFDKVLVGSLFANLAFKEAYGRELADGTFELTSSWQTALGIASFVGEIFGLAINGLVAERFGYRKTMIASLILVTAFIFIVFFADTVVQLRCRSLSRCSPPLSHDLYQPLLGSRLPHRFGSTSSYGGSQ